MSRVEPHTTSRLTNQKLEQLLQNWASARRASQQAAKTYCAVPPDCKAAREEKKWEWDDAKRAYRRACEELQTWIDRNVAEPWDCTG